MGVRIEPHAEPIPGYRLVERLGSGGFGEVWKAIAPGGIQKAIKFVYGEIADTSNPHKVAESSIIGGDDSERVRAAQEFKSLDRVKGVRHPYLLSLERYDVIQGQLVIVMELAERTLWDRFKECRVNGLPGIPRDELIGYLEEAAEVLDLMNSEHQLQHLDIKPQNLFLVSRHVKVADFGLVKDLAHQGNAMVTITGGVTPVYAAPESFIDEKVSRQSDQYSLAIVYQELLTGQRPIAGATMNQLYLHHLQNMPPDLSPLPAADRPITARALARRWEDRYPTCLEFIQLLRKAGAGVAVINPAFISGEAMATPVPMDTSSKETAGVRGGAGPVKTADPNFSAEQAFQGHRPRMMPTQPTTTGKGPVSISLPKTNPTPGQAQKQKAVKAGHSTTELPGLLQPALVIGLGKLGVETLTNLRRRMMEEFGPPDALPQLRLLAIDTDPEEIQQASNESQRNSLRLHEVFLARLQRPNYYIKTRDGKLPTDAWLNPKLLYRIPREQNQAGIRAIGRLALVDNFRAISRRLENELTACCSRDVLREGVPTSGLGLRSTTPRVYIATSLSGNTGSGMFLDVAYLMRKLLRAQGHENAEIVGVFYVPRAHSDTSPSTALANAYAALVELQHFSGANVFFEATYETAASATKDHVKEAGHAFDRCILLPLPDSKAKRNAFENRSIPSLAADFLCRDLTSILGPAIDEQRRHKLNLGGERSHPVPLLQTFGMYRLHWPRHALLEHCARGLCRRLVTRWMSKDAKPLADTIKPWTLERWEALGMRPEDLIERFQTMAEHALQEKPEAMLAEILTPLHQALVGDAKQPRAADLGLIAPGLARFESLLGHPDETRAAASGNIEPSKLERAYADIAHVVADECEQKLAELAVTLLEDPSYRLAGAEEALRQFCTMVELALTSQETLARELAEKSKLFHQRTGELAAAPAPAATAAQTGGSMWGMGKKSSPPTAGPTGADVFELMRSYAKTRYHSLILIHLNRLYVGLRGHLSDQIREVGFCRQRLSELAALLAPAELPRDRKAAPLAHERVLYPTGCLDLGDAIERVNQEITPEDLLAFDQRVQAWITTHCQALLEVCMGTSTTVKNLTPAMIREAEAFLNVRMRGNSVAEMYLARKRGDPDTDDDAAVEDLRRCHEEAMPELGRLVQGGDISVVSVSGDDAGKHLQRVLKLAVPEQRIIITDRQDEILMYREIFNLQWRHLEQLGPVAKDAYQKRLAADPSSVHSREDITDWQT